MYYDFNPGTLNPSESNSGINFLQLDKKKALETAFYIGAEQTVSDNFEIAYGLRYSIFNCKKLIPEFDSDGFNVPGLKS